MDKTATTPRHALAACCTAMTALLFIYAAAAKLLVFSAFRHQLYNQDLPHPLAAVLAYLLPALEIATVVLLLYRRSEFAGLLLATLLLALFSGYIALALLHFWGRIPCSCGGIISRFSWKQHLAFNLVFLLLAGYALADHIRRAPA